MRKCLIWPFILLLVIAMTAILFASCKAEEAAEEVKEEVEEVAEEVEEEVEEAEEEVVEEEAVEEEKEFEGYTIGVAANWMTHEYFMEFYSGFQERCDYYGIEEIIIDCEGDYDKMVSALENLITSDVDGLYPSMGGEFNELTKKAADQGIVIFADWNFEGCTGWLSHPQFNMTRDTGKIVGDYIKANWPEDKEVNVFTISILYPSTSARTDGFIIGLLESGIDVNWVQEVDGGGNLPTALETATTVMTAHPEINVVFGINDDSMFGGYEAADKLGYDLDEMIFVGCGAEGPKAKESLLEDNAHIAETAMFPHTAGMLYVEMFVKAWRGEEVDFFTPFNVAAVTADNFYDYFNEDLSEKGDVVLGLDAVFSEYPFPVLEQWDRGWYTDFIEKYNKDFEAFKTEYPF